MCFPLSNKKQFLLRGYLYVAATFLCAVCMLHAFAPSAWADDFSITDVNIQATLLPDGTLNVFETRTFDFDGSFNGVYWKLPKGSYQGRSIRPQNISVGIVSGSAAVPGQEDLTVFTESSSGDNATYSILQNDSYDQIKLYSPQLDQKTRFFISYDLPYIATRYADTAELYWKYVSDGWDVKSQNVNCTLTISGSSNAKEIRAWGHGALNGSVAIKNNGQVVFENPYVGSDDFAEMRVCFPKEWLSQARTENTRNISQFKTILAEEKKWAEQTNFKITLIRIILISATIGVSLFAIGAIVYAWRRWHLYKKTHQVQFRDEYFRDVPSKDHPALLDFLLNNTSTPRGLTALTASLMSLTNDRKAKLVKVDMSQIGKTGISKKEKKESWGLTLEDESFLKGEKTEEDLSNPLIIPHNQTYQMLEESSVRFIFKRVLPLLKRNKDKDGKPTLFFSELKKMNGKAQKEYAKAYESWVDDIKIAAELRGYFVDQHKVSRTGLYVAGALSIVLLAIWLLIAFKLSKYQLPSYAPFVGICTGALLIAAAVFSFVCASQMLELSPEAIEIKAKSKALKHWLEDFTRLKEAVPQDILLWNRLLIMAVILNVSQKVIDQLKLACPQFFEEDMQLLGYNGFYYSSYAWFSSNDFDGGKFVSDSFSDTLQSALVAGSAAVSGSGFGGGFSGGGGGGFGGGGGGGAF